MAHLLADGAARDHRAPEVAPQEAPQEPAVLDEQGLVEPHPQTQRVDGLLRRVVAERGHGGIAGDDPDDDEHDGDDGQEDREGEEEPLGHVAQHGRASGLAAPGEVARYFASRVFSSMPG